MKPPDILLSGRDGWDDCNFIKQVIGTDEAVGDACLIFLELTQAEVEVTLCLMMGTRSQSASSFRSVINATLGLLLDDMFLISKLYFLRCWNKSKTINLASS